MSISVIAITLNEEHNLKDFINNVKNLTPHIFIVDSFSSDKTVDIALNEGAEIVQRKFINFSDQWNFAINNLPFDTEWVFKLDPDERISDKIIRNINEKISHPSDYSGFSINRRLFFLGKRLNVKQEVLRIWKNGKCKFSNNKVNEFPIISGATNKIRGEIDHLDSPSLEHWIAKQNKYTTMEAIELINFKATYPKKTFTYYLIKEFFFLKYLFTYH